jgi:hypothetical protein
MLHMTNLILTVPRQNIKIENNGGEKICIWVMGNMCDILFGVHGHPSKLRPRGKTCGKPSLPPPPPPLSPPPPSICQAITSHVAMPELGLPAFRDKDLVRH